MGAQSLNGYLLVTQPSPIIALTHDKLLPSF